MLELLDGYDGGAAARQRVIDGVLARQAAVVASRGRGDRALVARAEAEVAADPRRAIRLDADGVATVYAAGRRFAGGRFETPTLGALRARAMAARARAGQPAASARLWLLLGQGPVTDIGALQATAAPGSLFQVASQFNCLEAPGAFVTPVHEYLHDPTQGPRASISAFPGALVRHYAAPGPDGARFVQTHDGAQVDLLADVCGPGVARVHNGYLRGADIAAPRALAAALEDRFDAVRVGVHAGVEVVLGASWDGAVEAAPHRTIAQVFTSTVAGGMYGTIDEDDRASRLVLRQLQRAAYLGTLLAAAALGQDRACLTLIGGGVFANPPELIWDAIGWATDQLAGALHRDLTVIVNGRDLDRQLPADALEAATTTRGGGVVRIDGGGHAHLGA